MDKDNGQNPPPPESLHFERSAVKCQRCKREFANFILEEIDDLVQLRSGDVLLPRSELVCLHCGWHHYWNIYDKSRSTLPASYQKVIEEQTKAYKELIKRYAAE